jgi:NAD(P)H-flavin reductase
MVPVPIAEPAAAPAAMVPLAYRVVATRRETFDTWTLELEPDGASIAPMAPGQFAMLYAFGSGEVPISLSGDPGAETGPLVHTIRAYARTTRALCALSPGAAVGVRGPFGRPWPLREAEGRDVVLVAGGIGLAPLRPVVYHVLAHREHFGRLTILYGARAPEDLLYLEEIERWRELLDVGVDVTVDAAGPGWHGRVGVVTTLVPRVRFQPGEAIAMICGPEVMMRFATTVLRDRGMASEDLHVTLERSMKCAVGHCGHCQLGPAFICKDGPVFRLDAVQRLLGVREL